jgi:2,4-diketo-3-deoxy-L-fuconate hydrolase
VRLPPEDAPWFDGPVSGAPFALGTFAAEDGVRFAALVLGGQAHELEAHLGPGATVRSLLEDWDEALVALQALADRLASTTAGTPLEHLRPLPPIQPAGQLFLAGANYRQHLVELMTASPERMHHRLTDEERLEALTTIDERAREGTPYVFLGLPYAVCGAEDDIVLPSATEHDDWELELAAVIGRRARKVPRERALDVVAGYTICNDITARDRVFRPDLPGIGTDWLSSKSRPTFFPTGPWIVPAAHVGDPMDLRITLRLNGEIMQDESTADMMFDIARLIEHASSVAELRPGDLLLTGSPAGNGVHYGRFLRPGDVIESEITGLGRQRNRCVSETLPPAEASAAGQSGAAGATSSSTAAG